jgi:ribA/ribD-fused uncharacterized protein
MITSWGGNNIDSLKNHLHRFDFVPNFKHEKIIESFDLANRFLSNFYMHAIEFDGAVYASNEHAYQASKTLDENWKEAIRLAETPGKARKKGREAPIRPDWDDIKDKVMKDVLDIKFQDADLKVRLIDTYPSYLVEGTSWHDNYWGICLLSNCPKCMGKSGLNRLGVLLMELREKIIIDRLQEEVEFAREVLQKLML